MALQAEQVDVAHLEHVRVRSSMDVVAGFATIRFDGRVFIDKGSLFVHVAFEADSVLRR